MTQFYASRGIRGVYIDRPICVVESPTLTLNPKAWRMGPCQRGFVECHQLHLQMYIVDSLRIFSDVLDSRSGVFDDMTQS